ncbi:hypothetical protein Sspor_50690 [Streptomyces spororaveus]|uniref:Uncharacterized protein n=1 Tax=Streptomyces spororaveus TaxID=284039 RepID=A0ABQ3TGH1_9ACTN|nr:hypothetical protein Sspor_50690 [Streptomyces spororaveus]
MVGGLRPGPAGRRTQVVRRIEVVGGLWRAPDGRRSQVECRIEAVGGLCPAHDGLETLRDGERVAMWGASPDPAGCCHGPRLSGVPAPVRAGGLWPPRPDP